MMRGEAGDRISFYRVCLDCGHFSFGWAEDRRCAYCSSVRTVAATPEEANVDQGQHPAVLVVGASPYGIMWEGRDWRL